MKLSEGAVCLPKLHFLSFWISKDSFPPPAQNIMIEIIRRTIIAKTATVEFYHMMNFKQRP